jgi:serine/threonine protein kinase
MQLKPTMRHASRFGTSVVVKYVPSDSNEASILQYLHSTKPAPGIIPLLKTFRLDLGHLIILPEGNPLRHVLNYSPPRSDLMDFSRQLIDAVSFLHQEHIAHLDIKPQNLVVLKHRLFIIDFGISAHVDGPETLINYRCGTPGWMAPEIEHPDGPRLLYSPIRADLWSCGLVLEYLWKHTVEENPFKELTRQLLDRNPWHRPLLVLVTAGHSLIEPEGGMKRKQDAHLPDVKRRKAIGLGLS